MTALDDELWEELNEPFRIYVVDDGRPVEFEIVHGQLTSSDLSEDIEAEVALLSGRADVDRVWREDRERVLLAGTIGWAQVDQLLTGFWLSVIERLEASPQPG